MLVFKHVFDSLHYMNDTIIYSFTTVDWPAAICVFDTVGFYLKFTALLDFVQWQYFKAVAFLQMAMVSGSFHCGCFKNN